MSADLTNIRNGMEFDPVFFFFLSKHFSKMIFLITEGH